MDSNVVKEAAEFIKQFEGYHTKLPDGSCTAYLDPIGIPTVGWGSIRDTDGSKVKMGTVWSLDTAQRQLEKETGSFLVQLLKASPSLATEPNRRVVACLSFCFNLGMGSYRASTFKKKVDQGNWVEAKDQIQKWNKAGGKILKGLIVRRKAEALLL